MSTSRWNLLPFRMFRGLPAAAHEVTGSPVMGFVGQGTCRQLGR
jgi:hypothetical protein